MDAIQWVICQLAWAQTCPVQFNIWIGIQILIFNVLGFMWLGLLTAAINGQDMFAIFRKDKPE